MLALLAALALRALRGLLRRPRRARRRTERRTQRRSQGPAGLRAAGRSGEWFAGRSDRRADGGREGPGGADRFVPFVPRPQPVVIERARRQTGDRFGRHLHLTDARGHFAAGGAL